jgi:cyanophycinase
MTESGLLALVGGNEWTDGCTFDTTLLAASGGLEVVVLPTAAAYQHPERVALRAAEWFGSMGASVEGLMVLDRASAEDPGMANVIRQARFVYVAGGSPLHLKSVLKNSAALTALREAWAGGAVLAASAAGAMALTDPMVDPRGGALTLGLGLVDQLAVIPQFGDEAEEGQKLARTVALAPAMLPVVIIPERTALLRTGAGAWSYEGVGVPTVYVDGRPSEGVGALSR